jgi:hypothetical protein
MKDVVKRKYPLILDLQLFADNGDESGNNEDGNGGSEEPAKIEFTPEQQAEIDRIIRERLERQKRKFEAQQADAQAEAERKKREENEEFRKLYEETKAELDRIRAEAKAAELSALKTRLLVEAGYSAEQITRISKYVVGEDEDAIKASIDEIKADIPPRTPGVDPNPGNNPKPEPKPTDPAAEVRARLERLKKSGKLR